jgi:VWFA-related protein
MPTTKTLALTLTAALATLTAHAQSSTPTLHVSARETIVDVTVTDNKGKPVHNLTRDDFTISEDGHPQPIRAFSETRSDNAAPAPPPRKLPPGVYTNFQPAPSTGAANIILFDDLNLPDPYDRVRSRQHAIEYIKSMPPGTQVALVELGAGLRIMQGFTTDPNILIAAINDKQNAVTFPPSGMITLDCPPEWLDQTTLQALRDLARVVAGTRGRKNLLWFTIGMKRVTDPQFLPPCEIDPTPALHQTYALLADAQIAVYSVDPRGVQNIAMDAMTSISAAPGPISARSGAAASAALAGTSAVHAGDLLSMESVAESTGGGAFYNTNDISGAIAHAIDKGSSFYSISYVPPSAAYDGRHHIINVKADRPGLHLVYRTSYYAEDPYKSLANPWPKLATAVPLPKAGHASEPNAITTSMARFAPPATQLLFDVKVLPAAEPPLPTDPPVMGVPAPRFKDKPLTRYDILFSLPAEQIAFDDTPGDTHSGSLEFDAVAYDVSGALLTSRSLSMSLPLTAEEYRQFLTTPFQFYEQLDLPPGQTFLRLGILDKTSNKIGTIEIPLTVPKP